MRYFKKYLMQKQRRKRSKFLQEHNTQALRSVLIVNFDESIVSLLPEGAVPYTPNDAPDGTEHTVLEKECRILYHFFKGGSSINQTKRESMFIRLLEGLTAGEAEVLCLAKDKEAWKALEDHQGVCRGGISTDSVG